MLSHVALASMSLTRVFPCCAALVLTALSLSFVHFSKECAEWRGMGRGEEGGDGEGGEGKETRAEGGERREAKGGGGTLI